ncbi:MAG: hypothetical protein FJX25_11960 [Alphaproteobacteria bacterium]|nr:hypothetical protein [Alphaproteobacteria bacterium]
MPGWTGGFAGLGGSGGFGSLIGGVSVNTQDQWNLCFSLLFNIGEYGTKSAGARASIAKPF